MWLELLKYYSFFSLVTAIVACYELLAPVIASEKLQGRKVEDEVAMYIASLGLFLLMSPLIFVACIVPSIGENFRIGLQKGCFDKQ